MRRLAFQLVAFALLLAAAQTALVRIWPNPPPSETVRDTVRSLRATVVLLGDSVNHTPCATDTNRAPISRMLARRLAPRVAGISRGGFDLAVFDAMCRFLARRAETPRTVFIEVNVASLWGDGRSPYTTHKLVALDLWRYDRPLLDAWVRPLQVWRFPLAAPDLRLDAYLDQPVVHGGRTLGPLREFQAGHPRYAVPTEAAIREHVIVRYLQPLAPNNRLLDHAASAARALVRRGHRAVFFVVPVNHEVCEPMFPGEFRAAIAAKVAALRRAVEPQGAEVIDLSTALPADCFAVAAYPNEHLNQRGRDFVAARLADVMPAGPGP